MTQLDLFGGAPSSPEDKKRVEPLILDSDLALAERLPPWLRLGTSSWSFPGWRGIVWQGEHSEKTLAQHGLAAYARHPLLRTVGVDRTYYAPITAEAWRAYADVVPSSFRFIAKAWSETTMMVFPNHPRLGERAGRENPLFADVETTLRDVVTPYLDGAGERAGPLVFEIPPHPAPTPDEAKRLAAALDRLFAALPRARYAVELRNRAFLTPRYLRVLAEHGVGHVLNFWSTMPTVGEQLTLPGILTAPDVVCRLMLPPGEAYDDRKRQMAPFDRIVDPQPEMRADVKALFERVRSDGRALYVSINNKAEGSAPLTARALAEVLANV